MHRTRFRIAHMDCPAEERLVRMRLEPLEQVADLRFDLPARQLAVIHRGDAGPIKHAVSTLGFGDEWLGTESNVANREDAPATDDARERYVLRWVLGINATFFVLELVAGLLARSMGLVADSLDMLADAAVYGLSLFAVGGAAARKARVATISGYLQAALATLGFAEVVRRVLGFGGSPEGPAMIAVAALALVANAICLYLLNGVRSDGAHLRASQIFTANDIVINAGVIAAGGLVWYTGTRWPDLVVGAVVFAIVTRGALRILRLGRG